MVYFPDAVFNHITTYLIDPDFYKKKHAEVWQKIRVNRRNQTEKVFDDDEANDYEVNDCQYLVYTRVCGEMFGYAEIPVRDGFGLDDLSGEWDNVEQTTVIYENDAEYYERHNWAGQDE